MNKIFLFLLVVFFSVQTLEAKRFFVEMEFHKNQIKLDDGTNKKRQALKDNEGNELKFISLIGALNYMSLQGWELIGTKSVIKGCSYIGVYGGAGSTDTKVYYIFSKEVSDEELEEAVNNSYKE